MSSRIPFVHMPAYDALSSDSSSFGGNPVYNGTSEGAILGYGNESLANASAPHELPSTTRPTTFSAPVHPDLANTHRRAPVHPPTLSSHDVRHPELMGHPHGAVNNFHGFSNVGAIAGRPRLWGRPQTPLSGPSRLHSESARSPRDVHGRRPNIPPPHYDGQGPAGPSSSFNLYGNDQSIDHFGPGSVVPNSLGRDYRSPPPRPPAPLLRYFHPQRATDLVGAGPASGVLNNAGSNRRSGVSPFPRDPAPPPAHFVNHRRGTDFGAGTASGVPDDLGSNHLSGARQFPPNRPAPTSHSGPQRAVDRDFGAGPAQNAFRLVDNTQVMARMPPAAPQLLDLYGAHPAEITQGVVPVTASPNNPGYAQPPPPDPATRMRSSKSRRCPHCLTSDTGAWRYGPVTEKMLCNACGQHEQKHNKLRPLETEVRRMLRRANGGR